MNCRTLVTSFVLVAVLASACTLRKDAAEPESESIEWLRIPEATLQKCGLPAGEGRLVETFFTFDAQQKVTRVRVEPVSPSRPEIVPSPDLCRCLEGELGQTRVAKGNFPAGVEMRQRLWIGLPEFSRAHAAQALASIKLQGCKRPEGMVGTGHVTITFLPSGKVSQAKVDGGPFAQSAVGKCVTDAYAKATIPPFAGPPVKVGKTFYVD